MARDTTWKDLKVGILAAAVLVALVVSIFVFARVGAIRGEKFKLHVLTDDASGVLQGTEVWLSGQKVGLVTVVEYRPTSVPLENRLVVSAEIRADQFPLVRRDTKAEIRPGGNLIGSPVIMLTGGTASSPPVQDGDTLQTIRRARIEGMMTSVHRVTDEISALGRDISKATAQAKSPSGTSGAFLQNGMPPLSATSARFSRLRAQMTNGNGTIGLAMSNDLFAKASEVMSSVDSVRALLTTGSGNVGRFRKDSTLGPAVKGVLARVDSLRAIAANPVGSIGKSRADSVLSTELARARRELDALMKDIKKRPLRYIKF